MVKSVNEVPPEIVDFFEAAFAGSAEVTMSINAITVSPICFTISSKWLYYL